ncbi:MAG: type II secretion system secretin GspD [Desulfobacula sp.]|uniref:type II secretion system secretin GspD n=1 Tax=Desulfobacula sp. TaxID=2593537 RepID=UPI0025BB8DB5|nr:type II secretion system secretin GspD [Desulfobacula sp.]MCD4718475.1 type II secretion system secretin GspD [Desulfobacula sp.]
MFYSRRLVLPIFILYIFCTAFLIFPYDGFAAEPSEQAKADSKYVSIDFNNVDINVFIKFISKLTGKNFVVDSRVKGNVTIISPTKISVKDAYKVFESVLEINGFSTVESGKVIKIIPTPKAKADNIDTKIATGPARPETLKDRIVTRLIPLEYARSDELKNLFTPLVPKGSVVLSYRDTNMLIVTATLSSINRLLKIVEVIDVQSIGKKISVIPVKFADVKKMVQNLSSIFSARIKGTKGKLNTDLVVKFVADERINSIIILASKVETDRVKQLIAILDQEVPKGEEKIRVYYLEHASAENLVKVLLEIPTKDNKKAVPGQKRAPILSTKVKIMADKATNSLIIMADKEDYPVLEEVISKLDIPRAMVYIECLIMEVNVTRGLNVGTEWKTGVDFDSENKVAFGGFGGTGDSGYANLGGLIGSGSFPKGFSVGVLGKTFSIGGMTFPNIQAVIQAFQSDKDVNILANPQILTTENEEASITVGKNVPFQTRSAADSGAETYSSFEYKDVGISLKITPQISKDRLVRLNVYQELTKLDTVNQTSPDRPTTFKRQIETTIIVEDGNSVVIGGLIDEALTKTEYKTPCLGNIPGLGWAFKNISEGIDKTNLYVFLTPRVIKNSLEADEIYKEKKKNIDNVKKGEVFLYEKINKLGKKKEDKTKMTD